MYKLNEKGASSWDLVLKILSITLVSLFAFSSGVWFGKKLSDSDYQRQALEGEFDKEVRKTASAGGLDSKSDSTDEEAAGHDSEALTDEEVMAAADKALQSNRESTKEAKESGKEESKVAAKESAHGSDGHSDGHGVAKSEPTKAESAKTEKVRSVASTTTSTPPTSTAHGSAPAAHGSAQAAHSEAPTEKSHGDKKPDLSAVHQAAARVANNAAPVAKEAPKQESRIPSSLPKTVGATNDVEFTVQVASYPTSEAAKEHVDSLVKKGFPAFPVEAKINGKVWYRVSVGSFKTFNDASKYRAQLLKQSDLPSAIVSKIAR